MSSIRKISFPVLYEGNKDCFRALQTILSNERVAGTQRRIQLPTRDSASSPGGTKRCGRSQPEPKHFRTIPHTAALTMSLCTRGPLLSAAEGITLTLTLA